MAKSAKSVKVQFTQREDKILSEIVTHNHGKSWEEIVELFNEKSLAGRYAMPLLRTKRQLRDRWNKFLAPNINRNQFSPKEDEILMEKYDLFGSKWVSISKFIPGRSDMACKNRFKVLQRKYRKKEKIKKPKTEDTNTTESKNVVTIKEEDNSEIPNSQSLFGLPPDILDSLFASLLD